MVRAVINWIGQPASLLTVWLFAGSVYGLLWWWSRPQQPAAPTGLLAWVREPATAETPADDDEQDKDEPEPDDDVVHTLTALPAVPEPATTARTFRLGDQHVTFNFRDHT